MIKNHPSPHRISNTTEANQRQKTALHTNTKHCSTCSSGQARIQLSEEALEKYHFTSSNRLPQELQSEEQHLRPGCIKATAAAFLRAAGSSVLAGHEGREASCNAAPATQSTASHHHRSQRLGCFSKHAAREEGDSQSHQKFSEGLNLALQASQTKHLLQLRISKPEPFQVCERPAITLLDKVKPRDAVTCELPGQRTALAYPTCAMLRPPASAH